MNRILIILLLVSFYSCMTSDTQDNEQPNQKTLTTKPILPLEIDSSEGWGDVRLSIVERLEGKTELVLKTISTHEGQELGVQVTIPKAQTDQKGFGKGIVLKTIGKKSDNLLQLFSRLYQQNGSPLLEFKDSIRLNYVDLSKFAKAVTGTFPQDGLSVKKYKLFFEGKTDEEYAELFLNYNSTENWLEIKEKDEEYRPLLIKFLSR